MRSYGMSEEGARRERLLSLFFARYGRKPSLLLSSPGGAELIGGMTEDHFGKGICTAISRDLLCAADGRQDDRVEIMAEGMDGVIFSVHDLENRERERGRLVSLTRGVLRYFKNMGLKFNGFSAFFHSELLQGASFSAAYSVLIAKILNTLYFGNALTPMSFAAAGTYAENFTFGKCDSFSEHVAIVNGGCSFIDFNAKERAGALPFPKGYGFILVDLCGIFDPLPQEIRLKKEMSAAAAFLGKRTLGEVPFPAFREAMPGMRRTIGDRAALSGLQFYEECGRAERAANALKNGDNPRFFYAIFESGEQSVGFYKESMGADAAMLALRVGGSLLKKGAVRLNGSTVLAVGDEEEGHLFHKEMIRLFGRDRVKRASFREGGCSEV